MIIPVKPATVPKEIPILIKDQQEKCTLVPFGDAGGAIDRINQMLQVIWNLAEQLNGRHIRFNDVFLIPPQGGKRQELAQYFRNAGWDVTVDNFLGAMLFKLPANCRAIGP